MLLKCKLLGNLKAVLLEINKIELICKIHYVTDLSQSRRFRRFNIDFHEEKASCYPGHFG